MKYGIGSWWISPITGSKLEIVGVVEETDSYEYKNHKTGFIYTTSEQWVTDRLQKTTHKSIVSPETVQKYPINYCFTSGFKYRVVGYTGLYTLQNEFGSFVYNVSENQITGCPSISLGEFTAAGGVTTISPITLKSGLVKPRKEPFCIN